jgi:hypothetical protein
MLSGVNFAWDGIPSFFSYLSKVEDVSKTYSKYFGARN